MRHNSTYFLTNSTRHNPSTLSLRFYSEAATSFSPSSSLKPLTWKDRFLEVETLLSARQIVAELRASNDPSALSLDDCKELLAAFSTSKSKLWRPEFIWNLIKDLSLDPDDECYVLIFRACATNLNFFRLKELYDELRQNFHHPSSIAPFNELLRGLSLEGDREETAALLLFDDLRQLFPHLKPNADTYAHAIRCCRLKNATLLWNDLLRSGIEPNVAAFNSFIWVCGIHHYPDRARELLSELRYRGFEPNEETWAAFLDSFGQRGRVRDLVRLHQYFHVHNLYTETLYEKIVQAFARNGRFRYCNSLIRRLKQSGVQPSKKIYMYMVKYHGQWRNWRDAERWFRLFKEQQKPTAREYSALLNALSKSGKFKMANFYWQEMLDEGLKPKMITYVAMISCCRRRKDHERAKYFLREMRKKNFPITRFLRRILRIMGLSKLLNRQEIFIPEYPFLPQLNGEERFRFKEDLVEVKTIKEYERREQERQLSELYDAKDAYFNTYNQNLYVSIDK